jgi:excisionase family DNA binding protein
MPETPLVWTRQQAASRLTIGLTKLDEEIKAGRIETVRLGARRLVPEESLRQYVGRLSEAS